MKLYTEEQVENLLWEQRKICEESSDWLSYPDTKFFAKGKMLSADQPDLDQIVAGNPIQDYEYEMFFKSDPTDFVKIDGWYPIATERIRNPERIEKYIQNGLLRKVNS